MGTSDKGIRESYPKWLFGLGPTFPYVGGNFFPFSIPLDLQVLRTFWGASTKGALIAGDGQVKTLPNWGGKILGGFPYKGGGVMGAAPLNYI